MARVIYPRSRMRRSIYQVRHLLEMLTSKIYGLCFPHREAAVFGEVNGRSMTPEPWQLSALKFYSITPVTGSITGGTDTLNGGAVMIKDPTTTPSCSTSVPATTRSSISTGAMAPTGDGTRYHQRAGVRYSDWTALQAVITDNGQFGYALIQLSATDSITLYGVVTADLHQTDFII